MVGYDVFMIHGEIRRVTSNLITRFPHSFESSEENEIFYLLNSHSFDEK